MKKLVNRMTLVAVALTCQVASAGTLDLDFISHGTSTYYEYFSAGFYRMDLYSPPPNQMNQSFHEIGNPTNIYNQAYDGFPNDNDFRFGSLTYDESTLVGGTGVANITGLNLGIPIDPDDPGHINSARWAPGTTTLVDSFSGTVTVNNGVVTGANLASDISFVLINVGGSTIPGTYTGTFDLTGTEFALQVTGAPEIDVFGTLPPQPFPLEWDFSGTLAPVVVGGDFNGDGNYDCADIDGLVADIAAGSNTPQFDLTGDSLVNGDDLNAWLSNAGSVNLGPGLAYLPGDANLSGEVNGSDFAVWNANKFTNTAAWCLGDFNADGATNGGDFSLWNNHKFSSSGQALAVPEPTWILGSCLAMLLFGDHLRRRTVTGK